MWQTQLVPGADDCATPLISVLAKKTYLIAHEEVATPSEEQIPIHPADLFSDPAAPALCEVVAESEMVPFKCSTDLIVLGKARSPREKLAYHLDCEVIAGPYRKLVRVFGERKLQTRALRGVSLGDPEPFSELTLGYRNAYGGVASHKDTLYTFPPNPIGKGFALKGEIEDVAQLEIPNLEDPQMPLLGEHFFLSKFSEWTQIPVPVSLGWTKRNFFPRYTFAGVLLEHLESVMQLPDVSSKVPRMDNRFYQGASSGLWGKRLEGREALQLTNMDSNHPQFRTVLPGEVPSIKLDTGEGFVDLPPVLDTVVIDMERKLLTLLWRGTHLLKEGEQMGDWPKLEVRAD